jgi:hypothetical protein
MLGHTSTTTDAATSSAVENMPESAVTVQIPTPVAVLQRRKLNLKAEFESSVAHISLQRLIPVGFNVGLIGSTWTALPCWGSRSCGTWLRPRR